MARVGELAAFLALLVPAAVALDSYTTITTGSQVSQMPLMPCILERLCNGPFCGDVCVDGTVVFDQNLVNAVRFQLDLAKDRSMKYTQILGTHNAFISRTNGFGLTEDLTTALFTRLPSMVPANWTMTRIPNQRYGVTDLLNMGVRELELDIWVVPNVTPPLNLTFDVHVCHSPVPDPAYVEAVAAAAKAVNVSIEGVNFFTELCSNHTMQWALQRIRSWLEQPSNSDQVVAVYLDNRVWTPDIDRVTYALESVLGDILLTPVDVNGSFNGSFPSRAQMLAAGKRVYAESNSYLSNDYSNTSLALKAFYPTTWSSLQSDPGDATPFPLCTLTGAGDSWYGPEGAWTRFLDSTMQNFPDSPVGSILYAPSNIQDLIACGFQNLGITDVDPMRVLPGAVWTWAAGEPALGRGDDVSNCSAAAMTTVRGRWTAQPCSAAMPAVCRLGDPRLPSGHCPEAWAFSPSPVAWADAPAACAALGPGWSFDLPRDGRENSQVADKALLSGLWLRAQGQGGGGLWLNHQVA